VVSDVSFYIPLLINDIDTCSTIPSSEISTLPVKGEY